jgi:hypothetical protein
LENEIKANTEKEKKTWIGKQVDKITSGEEWKENT